jgi:hypothetical protein
MKTVEEYYISKIEEQENPLDLLKLFQRYEHNSLTAQRLAPITKKYLHIWTTEE